MIDQEHDEPFGFYEGECQACGFFYPLDDLGLCEDCSGKLERDLIRQRDWDYSALAFAVPEDKREDLRREIIKKYGPEYELIVPEKEAKKKSQTKKRPHHGRNR
jgi:hypothetical protein